MPMLYLVFTQIHQMSKQEIVYLGLLQPSAFAYTHRIIQTSPEMNILAVEPWAAILL